VLGVLQQQQAQHWRAEAFNQLERGRLSAVAAQDQSAQQLMMMLPGVGRGFF
jgi:hypothetical protein